MNDFFATRGQDLPPWLAEPGPSADVVLATQARLARNVAEFPFAHHADERDLDTLGRELLSRIGGLPALGDGWDLDLMVLDPTARRVLAEKMFVPTRLVGASRSRGLVLAADLSRGVVVNDEDHLRLHAWSAGLAPREALAAAMDLDTQLEGEIPPAFSPEWGYLTASPTNLGTGLRLGALLHLPGLVLVGEIEKVLNALRQLQFSVRGLFGDGGSVRGALFHISNLVTLGQDEDEIAGDFAVHVGKVVSYERSARDQLHGRDVLGLEDMVQRSRAILGHARVITSQETFDCLSNVRLGTHLGLLPPIAPGDLNRLTVTHQTAHLELAAGHPLSGRDKAAARAALVREVFAPPAGFTG